MRKKYSKIGTLVILGVFIVMMLSPTVSAVNDPNTIIHVDGGYVIDIDTDDDDDGDNECFEVHHDNNGNSVLFQVQEDGDVIAWDNLIVWYGELGVGVPSPVEKLEVDGAIKLGTTSNTNAGTIRWTGSNFQGYDGSEWKNLDVQTTAGSDGWTDDGAVVRLTTTNDKVGIGTNSPGSYKLNVAGGDVYIGGNIALSGTVDGYDISTYGQYFIDSVGSSGQVWKSDESGRGVWGTDEQGVTSVTGSGSITSTGGTDPEIGITLQKDIFAGSGLTGGADNVLPGSDSDVSLAIELKVTSGLEVDSSGLALADGIAGDGLSISDKVLAVNLKTPSGLEVDSSGLALADGIAGDGLSISDKVLAVNLKTPSGLEVDSSGLALADGIAGDGLSISGKVLAVNLKTPSGLEVDSSGLALADGIAGDGLSISGKVLAVGAGNDIDVNANTVAVEDDIDVSAIRASSGNGISMYDDDSNLAIFIEDATADVGIGTNAPETKLHIDGDVAFDDGDPLQIDLSDTITVTHSFHKIQARTGTIDILTRINDGGPPGQILIITPDLGDTITVQPYPAVTSNMRLQTGFTMNDYDTLTLIWDGSTYWNEVSRSSNV